MLVTIQPITIYPHQINIFRIDAVKIRSIGSDGSAIILCSFLTDEDVPVQSQVVEMPTAIYNTWGTDDNIVVDYALQTLGLTRA
jgi:hypothetical protein